MADGHKERRTVAEKKRSPKQAADQSGKDEHDIAASQMDERIEGRGAKPSGYGAEAILPMPLDETSPKELFSGADKKEHKKDDPETRRALAISIGPDDLPRRKRKDRPGEIISRIEDEIEHEGRKEPNKNLLKRSGTQIGDEKREIGFV